jgi:hypothetical protein
VHLNLKDFEINVITSFCYLQKYLFWHFLAGFESRDGRRQPSGNTNNNRPSGGQRQGGRNDNNYNQQGISQNFEGGYEENGYNGGKRKQ